jgi:ELWxxDGT repeat protein
VIRCVGGHTWTFDPNAIDTLVRECPCETIGRTSGPPMKTLLSCAVAVLCFGGALAQTPYLVSDINTSYTPNAVSSSPRFFRAAGSTVFFSGFNDTAGSELFKTNGTTVDLVKDIIPGSTGSSPSNIVALNGTTVVFSAWDAVNGRELWASDGTEAGTALVKDIYVGGMGSFAVPIASLSGRVFLTARSTGSSSEVWITDGTEAGTRELIDSPDVRGFFVVGTNMYFYSPTTLWRSDGTPEGTAVVRNDLTIRTMTVAGGRIFFAGWDAVRGYEIWTSDGTAAGTVVLKDINPGAAGSFNTAGNFNLGAVGSSIVFFAWDGSGWSLWRSDGTPDGTVAVRSYSTWNISTIPPLLHSAGGLVYFSYGGTWRTDGTGPGTITLGSAYDPSWFVTGASEVFFFARGLTGPFRLWSTDGSDAGTSIVSAAVVPGTPSEAAWAAGALYFSGSDGTTGSEPWVSDGTEGGTHLIANMAADPPASSNPEFLRGTTGRVYFTATNSGPREVWTSDGTMAGTTALTSFLGTKSFWWFSAWNGKLFFATASTGENSLYSSDGTPTGTSELLRSSASIPFPSSGYFYFSAPAEGSSSSYYRQLWRSDGTEEGTIDLSSSALARATDPTGFVEAGGRVYFEAGEPRGIWQTEGTVETTSRLTTHPTNYTSISSGLVAAAGGLYYALNTTEHGTELWRTDLIRRSSEVIDIRPGTIGSSPEQIVAAGPIVFFVADNGTGGREVWRSDGTLGGTFRLKDVMPGATSSTPRSLTAVGHRLFFVANDGIDGFELWTSDGTTSGTVMVTDIAPGAASSSPDYLVSADGFLWFSADDGSAGRELWKSDGTAIGTQRVADLNAGAGSSAPRFLAVAGRQLFFSAETSSGRELWGLGLNPTAYAIDDARVVEGNAGTATLRFKVRRSGDLSAASTVAFATSDGTATAGSDYVSASGTAAFAAGAFEAFIDISVNGDMLLENHEMMFVTISSPSVGVLENSMAIGTIEEDDRSAALSVQIVHTTGSYDGARKVVVTNTGPSDADGVTLRFTESPTVATLSGTECAQQGHGVVLCSVGTLVPGQSRTVSILRYAGYSGPLYNTASPPGSTITASVSTLTPEPDLTDNTISKMTTSDGSLLLPPFLTTNTAAAADYLTQYAESYERSVTLTSSNPSVTVTPATVTIPAYERFGSFALQPGDVTGTTKFTIGSYGPELTIAVVAPGTFPKLDPMFVASVPWNVKYPNDVEITARVAARAADGTFPTGVVSLLDNQNAVIDQQTVDSTASVKFVRTGLQPGSYVYSIRYEGDARFTPLTTPLNSFRVEPYSTSIRLLAPPVVCGSTVDVTVVVSTTETTQAPTGTVSISAGYGQPAQQATLTPTGVSGESHATLQLPVTSSVTSLSATYTPAGPFSPGYGASRTISVGCATAMNLIATATAANRVVLTWTGTASTYEIYRWTGDSYGGSWFFLGYAATTTYLDTTVSSGRSYLYRVRPTTSSTYSAPDLATTVLFTDDPAVARVTSIKAVHFTEILTAVNGVRVLAGLPAASFATTPAPGAPVSSAPIVKLRSALTEALPLLGRQAAFTDPDLAAGMLIRAVHVQELRDAVK